MLSRDDLNYDAEDGIYWMETDEAGLELGEDQVDEENLAFAGKVMEAYPERAADVAGYLAGDKGLAAVFDGALAQTIEGKLGRPVIRVEKGRFGRLSYVEQTLDEGHILDLEFGGVLEEFWNPVLDG